ncbi:MAG: sigma-70 family RNA polymerase sigma factor [Porticoccaceae bacterium]|nr:sigma-70 family RNA polymerase sigma factor [Porticoccaceae bacterium]
MVATDQALIERVAANHCRDSFSILVARHQSDLRYSLRQMTGWDEALADDLAQETFIKAFQAIGSYKSDAKFSSWLYRIAYNQMVSHFRLARNREVTGSEEALTSATETPVSGELSQKELHQDLARAMQQLPSQQRMVIHLYLHRQLTHQEICTIMEIPLGTVKTCITRGKAKLRELLSSWQNEEAL